MKSQSLFPQPSVGVSHVTSGSRLQEALQFPLTLLWESENNYEVWANLLDNETVA